MRSVNKGHNTNGEIEGGEVGLRNLKTPEALNQTKRTFCYSPIKASICASSFFYYRT